MPVLFRKPEIDFSMPKVVHVFHGDTDRPFPERWDVESLFPHGSNCLDPAEGQHAGGCGPQGPPWESQVSSITISCLGSHDEASPGCKIGSTCFQGSPCSFKSFTCLVLAAQPVQFAVRPGPYSSKCCSNYSCGRSGMKYKHKEKVPTEGAGAGIST